ncbi:Serine/threonine-protein phosphatase 2A regulatory subunit B'' subunit alpha [Kappamyces sp. JEL0829]|nr:Serine/threonine-protein phosphatase 2A regulatory subunit B'' subunit alpha [Kappamyces sp. JEL0829]
MGERKTPIKSILEAATDSIFGGASSRYLLPNPKRKVEAFFTQWMLFEGQNVVKSELEKIDVNLALESQGVIECLAGVVAELDMPDASASPALASADSQTVPPKSPSRRRKHSGSDAEMSDGKAKEAEIPLFYFPHGKPALDDKAVDWRTNIAALFGWSSISEGKKLLERDFLHVTVALGLSRYLNSSLFQKVSVGSDSVTFPMFQAYWESLSKYHHSDHSLAFAIMKQPQNNYLLASDVAVTTQVETVVTRLFYSKQHNWRKEMTLQEFKKSQFYECLLNLEKVEDVNATQDIFSYQHFYVIYCKFWELDRDHDMLINLPSLLRYDNGAMTPAILSRVMQGCGKPLAKGPKSAIMTYEDFIWFILSVEDKKTPQSIEYWFRCLDIDGDGVISLYELQQFYEDQYDRMMISRVSDVWKLEDFICSLMDLVRPKLANQISLQDLKKCGSAFLFFDMIFDLRRYDYHIRRIDPLFREMDDMYIDNADGTRTKLEGFVKFAARAYMLLAEEESQGNSFSDSSPDFDYNQLGDDNQPMDWDEDDSVEEDGDILVS